MSSAPDPRPAWRRLEEQVLSFNRLLGERMYQLSYIRWILGLAIILGALVGKHVVRIEGLNQSVLVLIGVIILLYNLFTFEVARSRREDAGTTETRKFLLRVMYGAVVVDYVMLTLAIWFVGGARSPFLSFYLLHAIVSGIMLSRRAALAFHGFAFALLSLLVFGEALGIPANLPEGAVAGTGKIDIRYAATVIVAYGVLFVLTGSILTSFSTMLRRRESAIRQANAELRRLSDMRRDFLDIALHNLQSPIGVAMMYMRHLQSGMGGEINDQQRQWVERSLERLGGLAGFMHDLSTLSTLEAIQLGDKTSPIDLRKLLEEIVRDHQDAAKQQEHTLTLEAPESLPKVLGVELLLREALVNYVTNAIKYTPPGGTIVVRGMSRNGRVRVEVEDNGVGISTEDQARLFNEFVRLRVKGKPVAKVRGSGLGLTIVKRVIEVHQGTTGVTSEPDRGSTFYVELPPYEEPPPPPEPPAEDIWEVGPPYPESAKE